MHPVVRLNWNECILTPHSWGAPSAQHGARLVSGYCTSLSVSNLSSLGARVLSAAPQTDGSSFKEERINYLSVCALSSSVGTSLLTLSNLFCWLWAQETDDGAAPRCEAAWRVEASQQVMKDRFIRLKKFGSSRGRRREIYDGREGR